MDQAAQELADTEDRLASDLQVLSDVFVGPLRAWAPQVSAELPRLTETLERLFGPLDEVGASCGEFAAELREAGASQTWAECFERHETQLSRSYGAYALGYARAWADLAEMRSSSVALDAFAKACELQPANQRHLTLASLAIMPVQRPPRYVLLLGELGKRLEKANEDATNACRALECAKRVAKAVDDNVSKEHARRASTSRAASHFKKCGETEAWNSLNAVRDGPLLRITKHGPVDCYIALFDDRLCYGDAKMKDRALQKMGAAPESPGKREERYVLHRTLKLENVYCCRSATESRGGAGDARGLAPWELLIVSAQKSFVLGAESAEAAAAWRDVISDAASKRRAALAAKDAPPRAVKAFVKRGAETRATDFDIVGLADDLVARPSGARRELGPKISHTSHTLSKTMPLPRPPGLAPQPYEAELPASPPPPPRPPPLQLPDASDDFVVTVPVDLQRGLGLELRNGAGTVEVAALAQDSVCAPDVRPGDVLLSVGDEFVQTTEDVVMKLRQRRADAAVSLRLRRSSAPSTNPFVPGSPLISPPISQEPDAASCEDLIQNVVSMGFGEHDAVRAVAAGRRNVDAVVNWILDNGGPVEEDPDLAFARRLQAEQQSPRGSNPFDSGRQPHVAGNPFA